MADLASSMASESATFSGVVAMSHFKLPFVALSLLFLATSSADAQLFRRFFAPPPQPIQGGYAPQSARPPQGYYGNQANNGRQMFRVEPVGPGRFVVVPVNPNARSADPANRGQSRAPMQRSSAQPQVDLARQAMTAGNGQTRVSKPAVAEPALEPPRSNSQNLSASSQPLGQSRSQPATNAAPRTSQQPQQYRRVTVFNPRTGQRSIRLIPIPSTALARQPYAQGQQPPTIRQPVGVTSQQPVRQTAVTGILTPPTASPISATALPPAQAVQAPIRLDSRVAPVTYNAPTLAPPVNTATRNQPTLAAPQPAIVSPVPAATKPLRGNGQYSVLDSGDEADSNDGASLELSAPAN